MFMKLFISLKSFTRESLGCFGLVVSTNADDLLETYLILLPLLLTVWLPMLYMNFIFKNISIKYKNKLVPHCTLCVYIIHDL